MIIHLDGKGCLCTVVQHIRMDAALDPRGRDEAHRLVLVPLSQAPAMNLADDCLASAGNLPILDDDVTTKANLRRWNVVLVEEQKEVMLDTNRPCFHEVPFRRRTRQITVERTCPAS